MSSFLSRPLSSLQQYFSVHFVSGPSPNYNICICIFILKTSGNRKSTTLKKLLFKEIIMNGRNNVRRIGRGMKMTCKMRFQVNLQHFNFDFFPPGNVQSCQGLILYLCPSPVLNSKAVVNCNSLEVVGMIQYIFYCNL